MNDAAIVTLAIGDKYLSYWQKYCERSWRAYAQKCNYDLIVITEPLDRSLRAAARSPAWQKCLVLSQEFSASYRQIISLDCDIVINDQTAPPITDQTPHELVGGVISGSHIHEDLRAVLLSRLRGQQFPYERGVRQWQDDQARHYGIYQLPTAFPGIVQTGVLVASPQHHRAMFEGIYAGNFPEPRSYEQTPLSHALLSAGVFRQIDTRFNSVFAESVHVYYPYLLARQHPAYDALAAAATQMELANNFFLHFAYLPHFVNYLAPQLADAMPNPSASGSIV
jgi:hypothetical protein